jgi:hypothetical protein
MRKYLVIFEAAVSHKLLCNRSRLNFLIYGENLIFFFISVQSELHTYDGWLQVDEDSPGDVLPGSRLGEEGVEAVVPGADGLVRGHLAIRLDS